MADEVTIRAALPSDIPTVLRFIQELAAYEGVPDGPKLTVEELLEDGFESNPPWFFVLLAEKCGQPVGQAMCNRAYSSWSRRAFYIEDLYVTPSERRNGVGAKIIQHICKMAVEEDVNRIDWHVLLDNEPALKFYRRLGARDLRVTENRAALRLDRHRIDALAIS